MARYKVSFEIPEARVSTAQKSMTEMLAKLGYEGITPSVTKIETKQSRADRLGEAESAFENAKSIVEELRDEMEEWHSNMPENLQSSAKGEEVEAARDALQEIADGLDGCDFSNVSFPGMY